MARDRGGLLILFDETQRADILREIADLGRGFSDPLSIPDWKPKQSEVCGFLFRDDLVTHWALAERRGKAGTVKALIRFSNVVEGAVKLSEVEKSMTSRLRPHMVRSRAGVGAKVPPGTWAEMKAVLSRTTPAVAASITDLETLRDRRRSVVDIPGGSVIAQERDATGVALEIFDQTGSLRRQTFEVPNHGPVPSFLDDVGEVRAVEGQMIAADVQRFGSGMSGPLRTTVVGAVFQAAGRTIEVFNVDRTGVESVLGVDLIYFNRTFNAWTLVQYKVMKPNSHGEGSAIFRPEATFDKEIGAMHAFRAANPDTSPCPETVAAYRLCGDGFYFKLCRRVQLINSAPELLPGMYIPRRLMPMMLTECPGPHGGRVIRDGPSTRHLTNTSFAQLVRDGWIGTRGISSSAVAEIIKDRLKAGTALVIARERDRTEPNLAETVNELSLAG